ncbi:hypothetical protein KO494_11500 [Lacinutrix sp. C3R15]|uniref:hypothetical protein n=1 Tax=Flavobacteriaceae TaxID=49546 RepID=UPI001C089EB7|nr:MULTISPECIES: hypothetical protein [Flavobacteriaceae]MBU2940161.1 hypothetical protein [Lacinutrix sp. C3R15]MDO6623478.1 hypothetical protein [Oceanihabitans sp. 1_MG-2023]
MKNEDEERLIKLTNTVSTFTTNTINSNYTINYVTESKVSDEFNQLTDTTSVSSSYDLSYEAESNVTFPIYLSDYKCIQIPKGIRRNVKRLPKRVLKKIDSNINVAIEKCFIFVSNLTYSVFRDDDCWKSLSSTVLHDQLKKGSDNTYVYKNIIKALSYSTNSTLPIIECRKNEHDEDSYQEGHFTKQYRFNYSYRNQNLEKLDIKFEDNLDKRKKYHRLEFGQANQNPIGKNLINAYSKIILPTENEIKKRGRELVKLGYQNRKGKILTFLNKKPKSFYSNSKNRTFVEENLKQFEYLVGNNFLIPKIGDHKSGGRVVDSFNLMPSWIRSMIKIDSEPIVELDYKALHPNIAMSIYGGVDYQISHEQIAKDLERPLLEVKIEHLSFFNKRVSDMRRSPLFKYYYTREKDILKKIIDDKESKGYKITSQKLFKKEVDIMTTCVEELNRNNIYVIYVYDALYCKASDEVMASEIMKRSVQKHNVYTTLG